MKLLDKLSGRKNEETTEHAINPVYDTAKSCLVNLVNAGCEEAKELDERLHFTQGNKGLSAVNKGVALFQESRYKFVNYNVMKTGYKNVLDIGCGYSPRGLLFAGKGINYVGADLPAVVNDMSEAVKAAPDDQSPCPRYIPVDATDPESLLHAAADFDGPVCIISEGLLMYFPIYELKEYMAGLKKVLEVHGGCVITPDFAMNRLLEVSSAATIGNFFGKLMQKLAASIVDEYTISTKNEMDASIWYKESTDDKPYKFFTENGFNVERIPVYEDGMELKALNLINKNKASKLIEEYKNLYGWKMELTHRNQYES